eukprot:TRINITY_DN22737_c0_g1_i2.p1 TRINITY_DN22737_c0_g1~~TRINITY_DN22737_c0_g1_i2.p1  ORF type:complete len:165 (+),score=10.89 TRINITY_DN22737_c0_g1_i2:62-556(+)
MPSVGSGKDPMIGVVEGKGKKGRRTFFNRLFSKGRERPPEPARSLDYRAQLDRRHRCECVRRLDLISSLMHRDLMSGLVGKRVRERLVGQACFAAPVVCPVAHKGAAWHRADVPGRDALHGKAAACRLELFRGPGIVYRDRIVQCTEVSAVGVSEPPSSICSSL